MIARALLIGLAVVVALVSGLSKACWEEDQIGAAVRKVTAAVANAGLPKSDYDPNSNIERFHGLMGSGYAMERRFGS